MDEDLISLEAELRQLRARPPRATLEDAIARGLAAPPPRLTSATTWKSWKWIPWSVAAAAMVAVGLGLWERESGNSSAALPAPETRERTASPAPGVRAFRPIAAERIYLADAREEWVAGRDGIAVRQLRRAYVDTVTWQEDGGRAAVLWQVPGEEIQPLSWPLH